MNTLARPEDLARYVPSFISKGLIADPSPPACPHSEPFLAAVLFADISGFTPLSERLTARGAEGVEQLTQVLNAYFGTLIEIITAHGGDVFKFAGDALLACWRAATPAGLTEAVQHVAQCGPEIFTGTQAVAAPVEERLSLRVGIGAGTAAAVRVGGVRQRWELLLVGQAVNEATRAAARGRPGAAALGPRACQMLGARGRGAELAANLFLLESVLEPRAPQPLGRPQPPPRRSRRYSPTFPRRFTAAWRPGRAAGWRSCAA